MLHLDRQPRFELPVSGRGYNLALVDGERYRGKLFQIEVLLFLSCDAGHEYLPACKLPGRLVFPADSVGAVVAMQSPSPSRVLFGIVFASSGMAVRRRV